MSGSFGALVVLGTDDLGDAERRLLRRLDGRSMLAILEHRLRPLGPSPTVFVMPADAPALRREAAGLGWKVLVRGRKRAADMATLLACLGARRWARLDPVYPFVDPEVVLALLARLDAGADLVETEPRTSLAPLAVMTAGLLRRRALARLLGRRLVTGGRVRRVTIPVADADLADCLTADTADHILITRLGGIDFSRSRLQALTADQAFDRGAALHRARDRLAEAVGTAIAPHRANARLARFEMAHGFSELRSLPPSLTFNISRVCNARCSFCSYPAPDQPALGAGTAPRYLSLARLEELHWLRLVERLCLGGDVGEPLLNPEFDDIFRYLRTGFPQLRITVISNGLGLGRERRELLVGELAALMVSLNAARRRTWERLMGATGFERVVEQLARLTRDKRRRRTAWPRLVLLAVLTRENVEELVELVELAHRLGAAELRLNHFSKELMPGCALPAASSLHHHRELADACLERAEQRARQLGIALRSPPRLGDGCSAAPADPDAPLQPCALPWSQCTLTVRPGGRPDLDSCCLPVDKGMSFSWSDLGEEALRALWNHEVLQHFRRTVNTQPGNRVCRACRRGFLEEPAGPGVRELAAGMAEIHAQLASEKEGEA